MQRLYSKSRYSLGLSIIMPSFNQVKYIEQAIDSVLSQNIPKLSLIVMDGGSTDGTLQVLEKYSKFIIFESQPDRGQSHALNKALKYANYEVTGWLNSDDLYVDGCFSKVLEEFYRDNELVLLHGKRILIDEKSRCLGWSKSSPFIPSTGKYTICSETAFWRTSALNGALFDESLTFAMDMHFLGRIAKYHPTKYLRKYLGCFRCHDDAKSSNIWISTGAPESEFVYRDLFGCDKYTKPTPRNFRSLFSQFLEFFQLPIPFQFSYILSKLRSIASK